MEKSGIVKSVEFKQEWLNPKGGIVYYHNIVLENGDKGTVGTIEKLPEKLLPLKTIWYTIDEKNRIKLVKAPDAAPPSATSGSQYKKPAYKSKTDNLSFLYMYAKDLVVAGKTTQQDVNMLKSIVEELYAHLGALQDSTEE